MSRTKEKEFSKRNIEEAIMVVEAYINNEYKSMYLMDAWIKLKEFTEANLK